jgi:putative NIF3 family GTP cyclohydrolase 1 type 2
MRLVNKATLSCAFSTAKALCWHALDRSSKMQPRQIGAKRFWRTRAWPGLAESIFETVYYLVSSRGKDCVRKALKMLPEITAQQIIERIQKNLGVAWKNPSTDMLYAGTPDAKITGVATTWTPSLEVLRRAVDAKINMIITRESPYWLHETATAEFSGAGAPFRREQMVNDPTFRFKQEFIARNDLVIYRFYDNWNARKSDGQLQALTAALAWDKYRKEDAGSSSHAYFDVPRTSLQELATTIQRQLTLRAMRVLGDPQSSVRTIALTHGFLLVPALEEVLGEKGVDVVVTGEPVEWEALPYFEDWITAGKGKGMIVLGHQASEEPGSGEVAAWMKSFLPEIPVEWLPAGEPFWPAKLSPANSIRGGAL